MLFKVKITNNKVYYLTIEEYNKKVKIIEDLDYDCEGEPEKYRKERHDLIFKLKKELIGYKDISNEELNKIIKKLNNK